MLNFLKNIFKYKQKRSPDKLGFYPEKVHTNAIPERRYLWTSRLLVIFAAISICLNIALGSTIYILLPQRSSAPRLLQKDPYLSQLRLLTRQEVWASPKDMLLESYVREYVTIRHTVTSKYDDLKRQWQQGSRFYWMSSEEVYKEFASENFDQLLHAYQSGGFTRRVNIEWARPIANGLWIVRFATHDYYSGSKTPVVNIWHAYLRTVLALIDYNNKSLRYGNPFGVRIISYSLSYIGTPDDVAGYLQKIQEKRLRRHY